MLAAFYTLKIQKVVKLNRLLQAACILYLIRLLFEFSSLPCMFEWVFSLKYFFSEWNSKWSEHKHFYDTFRIIKLGN